MRALPSELEWVACPVCGRDGAARVAGPEEIRHEMELLWTFHIRRLLPNTPPARLVDRVAFSQRPPVGVVRCAACGLVYRNPRERAHVVRRLYAAEVPSRAAMRALFENQRVAYRAQARRLTRLLGRPGTGLEVGSYVGGFLAAAREAGWRFEGVDINEAVTAFARERGLAVTCGDLQTSRDRRRFDAVAIWNCFDQLPDPRRAAADARALLREGGLLAVRVPNGAFYAALRRHLRGPFAGLARALLAHNNLLTFPYRHAFTPRALRTLLESTGFTVRHTRGDALVSVADECTMRWAVAEERLVRIVMRITTHGAAGACVAPWIEMYACMAT